MSYQQSLSVKSGLPPGSAVYIGDIEPEPTHVSYLVYGGDAVAGGSISSPDEIDPLLSSPVLWLRIAGLKDISLIQQIGEHLLLHPLTIEDILNTKSRTKYEESGEYLFLTLDQLSIHDDQFTDQQLSIVMKDRILLSVTEHRVDYTFLENRIRIPGSRFHQCGPDYLAYALLDSLVDSFFLMLENLDERLEQLEDEILSTPGRGTMTVLQEIRHDLIWFRRRVWAARDVITRLERSDSPKITKPVRIYFRDIYDHVIKISEDMDMNREISEGLMEIYLTTISNNMNQVMKVLTLIATVFIPLTFITSLYGMNFEYMAELKHPYGYWGVLMGMLIIALLEIWFFRKKGWI